MSLFVIGLENKKIILNTKDDGHFSNFVLFKLSTRAFIFICEMGSGNGFKLIWNPNKIDVKISW